MGLSVEQQHLFNYFKLVHLSFVEDTKDVYKEILCSLGENSDCVDLTEILNQVNGVIKEYDFEIVEGIDEMTSRRIHCLISTDNRTALQKTTVYDKTTTEMLSKIIRECVTSETGCTSEIFCLNIDTSLKSRKTIMQSSLQTLIRDKWLVSQNGKVTLGMRCHLELEQTIKKHYPDYVKYCTLCKSFLLQGVTCDNCQHLTHVNCLRKYCEVNKLSKGSSSCPSCRGGMSDVASQQGANVSSQESTCEDPPAKRLCKSPSKGKRHLRVVLQRI